jgi:hypothetical protein
MGQRVVRYVWVRQEPNISYICSRYYRAPELIFGKEGVLGWVVHSRGGGSHSRGGGSHSRGMSEFGYVV